MEVPDSLVNAILHNGARVHSVMDGRYGVADIELRDLLSDIDELQKLAWKDLKETAKKTAKS